MTGAFRLTLRTLILAASIIVGTAYLGQAAEPGRSRISPGDQSTAEWSN